MLLFQFCSALFTQHQSASVHFFLQSEIAHSICHFEHRCVPLFLCRVMDELSRRCARRESVPRLYANPPNFLVGTGKHLRRAYWPLLSECLSLFIHRGHGLPSLDLSLMVVCHSLRFVGRLRHPFTSMGRLSLSSDAAIGVPLFRPEIRIVRNSLYHSKYDFRNR